MQINWKTLETILEYIDTIEDNTIKMNKFLTSIGGRCEEVGEIMHAVQMIRAEIPKNEAVNPYSDTRFFINKAVRRDHKLEELQNIIDIMARFKSRCIFNDDVAKKNKEMTTKSLEYLRSEYNKIRDDINLLGED